MCIYIYIYIHIIQHTARATKNISDGVLHGQGPCCKHNEVKYIKNMQ